MPAQSASWRSVLRSSMKIQKPHSSSPAINLRKFSSSLLQTSHRSSNPGCRGSPRRMISIHSTMRLVRTSTWNTNASGILTINVALEFFAQKNDTSLLVLSIHSKKRPHCLTFVRTFDYKILDMLELYINPDTFRQLQQFKNKKPSTGLKPLIAFHGAVFEDPNQTKYTLAKSLLLDFFRGESTTEVDVTGLQYLISISAEEEEEGLPAPEIRIRFYLIKTKRSGQKLPRVEVEEMGPRIDFRVGREKFADTDMLKEAMKTPKGNTEKTKKNVNTDIMGDKVGKIHVGKQDLASIQTRKMKGLKRSRDALIEDMGDELMSEDETSGDDEIPTPKKPKA